MQALADAMPERHKVAVLLAARCQLRQGEVLGLRRGDIDPLRGSVAIRGTVVKTMDGRFVEKEPKTEADRRTVAVPPNELPTLKAHMESNVDPGADALVLDGGYRSLRTAWDNARGKTGLTHFHDLRHAGLTWSAATGASTAELMRRAGHASPLAALRYQHTTEDRDTVLAAALAELVDKAPVVKLAAGSQKAPVLTARFEDAPLHSPAHAHCHRLKCDPRQATSVLVIERPGC